MVTSGFYNSINHDRRYGARQFGSIFDGIIRDGVFMSIGDRFNVTASGNGMMVLVGIGRAWFDHSWTLNDALLPLTVPQSEVIMNRIDAVVLETNATSAVRLNNIKIVKGTPSSNPIRPTLVKTEQVHQYPLAYIQVNAQVTSIRQANITNMVGTSDTPFVTGILETMNIDDLIAQWKDQWEEYHTFWEAEWRTWYVAQTNAVQNAFLAWKNEWESWSAGYRTEMELTKDEWDALWKTWFYSYIENEQISINVWRESLDKEFHEWFDGVKDLVDGSGGTAMAGRVQELTERVEILEKFADDLRFEHAIYYVLEGSGYNALDYVLDNVSSNVLDNDSDRIIGRSYHVDQIEDNNGVPIDVRTIFCVTCERK